MQPLAGLLGQAGVEQERPQPVGQRRRVADRHGERRIVAEHLAGTDPWAADDRPAAGRRLDRGDREALEVARHGDHPAAPVPLEDLVAVDVVDEREPHAEPLGLGRHPLPVGPAVQLATGAAHQHQLDARAPGRPASAVASTTTSGALRGSTRPITRMTGPVPDTGATEAKRSTSSGAGITRTSSPAEPAELDEVVGEQLRGGGDDRRSPHRGALELVGELARASPSDRWLCSVIRRSGVWR